MTLDAGGATPMNGHPEKAWCNRGDLQCPWNWEAKPGMEHCCALRAGHLAPHEDIHGQWGEPVLDLERAAANEAKLYGDTCA